MIFSKAFHSKLRKDAAEQNVSMGKLIESSMSQGKRPARKSRLVRDTQTGLLMFDGGPSVNTVSDTMKTVQMRSFAHDIPRYVALVKRGETVQVTNNGVAVMVITKPPFTPPNMGQWVKRLEKMHRKYSKVPKLPNGVLEDRGE